MNNKETLTVEYLPAYDKYRVWNTWTEEWFTTWELFVKCVKENNLLNHFNFVSYNEETQKKLESELNEPKTDK